MTIIEAWRSFRARMAQTTPRERASLAVLAAAIALAASLWAFEGAMQAASRMRDALAVRADAEAMLRRDNDNAFQVALGAATTKVWRWSIVAPSEGVARAEAAGLVQEIALQAGLEDAEIFIDEPEVDAELIHVIPVRLSAAFDWGRLQALLSAIEASTISFGVRSIDVTQDPDAEPTLTLTMTAVFIAEPPP